MAPVEIADINVVPLQADRIAQLTTPLGADKLVLTRFEGYEGLSKMFEYTVETLSTEQNIDFDKALGKNCHVELRSHEGVKRVFNGVLVEADWFGVWQAQHAYRLVLRPWFWLLGRRSNCRVFKDKNVCDIIEDVFKDAGFSDYQFKAARGDYPKIEYTVQYRETDLVFVSRLMEEWGLYFFHMHSTSKHQLILADSRSCHVAVEAGRGTIPFIELDGDDRHDREHLSNWRSGRLFRTGKFALNEFDYMKPTADLKADTKADEKYEKSSLESYDYPGRYKDQDLGRKRSKVRLEAEQAADRRRHAAGDAPSLYPGGLMKLEKHASDDGQYLVVEARHHIKGQDYRSGGGGHGERYEGSYELQPVARPFRAPIVTPRPLVHGPQTALVVARTGSKGEEIDVDEEGRIFVQFHWNRDKDRYSLPVRVAQSWSGKQWGWQIIPRVGQEVVVEFLEGDPDQPLVVGTVYNKDYRYPYALPANKTMSGVKSRSTKTGSPSDYNELVFEDKKNEENIRMNAQRLHEVTVRMKETRTIGVDNKDSEVALDTTIEHGHEKRTLKHGDRATLLQKGDDNLKLEMGDHNVKLELGDQNVDVAKNISIKADMGITITCGQSKITMTPASIKIESILISVEAQAMTQVKGSAMVTVKGGLVMIN